LLRWLSFLIETKIFVCLHDFVCLVFKGQFLYRP
jgi:hypothetical protein